MPQEKIFLSAVSGQFKACRDALRSDLAAVGADVVVQEDFQQHGGTLLKKLEEYIDSCDRVIALVGNAHGWTPERGALPENAPSRSYTQWEYHFAMGERLDGTPSAEKPVYVYFAAPTYLEQHPVEQSDTEAQQQQQFITEIIASGKDHSEFRSLNELRALVLRDGFTLQGSVRPRPQNLPYDSLGPLFKGRDNAIAQIKANLTTDSERPTAIVAKQAIHGLGGVGKTRLAVEYAWHNMADYSSCFFVTADSPENLDRNIAELCGSRLLNLPEQSAQEQELQLAAALRWLNQQTGWLLILDNVDTPESASAVDGLLPSLQNGHVLITSRRTDWGNSINALPLDTLDEDDAVAFLLEKTEGRRSTTDTDATAACTLAQTLGGLALGLEQAGAFVNKKRISLSDYQQRWAKQEQKIRQWHDERVMHYPRNLAITWETSFEQLTSAAQGLLNLLSWFAPESIPRETFAAAFSAETIAELMTDSGSEDAGAFHSPDLEDLLDELETLSLLKWEAGNRSFSVHRLVQDITQARLGDAERRSSMMAAVELINKALPSDPPPDDVRTWPVWDSMRPHIERLINAAFDAGIYDPTTRLMHELGRYLTAKALFRRAEPLLRRALTIDEDLYGSDHPRVATDLNSLALLYKATNRLVEAEPLMHRVLALDEASFGSEHPRVATDLINLAQLLHETNRLTEAESLMRRALAIDEASYGTQHPTVAVDLNSLAMLFHDTNRLDAAESLMRRALAIDEASYGRGHPKVAVRLNNLAQLLQATNRTVEAEPLVRRALAIVEASYGSEHPNVANCLNSLALLLEATNRAAEAEALVRRALAIDEASYGSEHPTIARDLNNLQVLLQATNRAAEAEPIVRRALAIIEASYGSEHPLVAIGFHNLSQVLENTNRLAEAEPLSRRVVEILLSFTMRTGHEHPRLDTAIDDYMRLRATMGHDERESKAVLESLIDAVKRRIG